VRFSHQLPTPTHPAYVVSVSQDMTLKVWTLGGDLLNGLAGFGGGTEEVEKMETDDEKTR
jgi:hypothetical protein